NLVLEANEGAGRTRGFVREPDAGPHLDEPERQRRSVSAADREPPGRSHREGAVDLDRFDAVVPRRPAGRVGVEREDRLGGGLGFDRVFVREGLGAGGVDVLHKRTYNKYTYDCQGGGPNA